MVALYESDTWEGLIVCATCMQAVTKWLIQEQLIEDHPFAIALLDTDEESYNNEFRVWWQPDDAPYNSFSELWLTRLPDDEKK